MKFKITILFILIITLLINCSKKLSNSCKKNLILHDTLITTQNEKLKFEYLGCGGFIIQSGKDKILFDPFFSNPSFSKLAIRKKLVSDTNTIQKAFQNIDLQNIKYCFVSHSHYDHLMDVPYISKKFFNGKLKIHTNLTGENALLSKGIEKQYIHQIKTEACDSNYAGTWIYLDEDSTCRVLPIKYGHAPHFKLGPIKLHFYKGENTDNKFHHSHDWKEGQTFAYLIDFMKDKKITNRVYLLSGGASESPLGFIHQFEFFKERKIDVMVICIASHDNVKNYPQAIVQAHQPEYVIGAHWEDFFEPYFSKKHEHAVRFTNLPRFYKKMDALGYSKKWVMAKPLSTIQFGKP